MNPKTLHGYLAAVDGHKAADLATVAPGHQGERTDLETSGHRVPKSDAEVKKEKRLRAIQRAPEVVQDLYRHGLIPQTGAVSLGPKSPTPEEAVGVVIRCSPPELPRASWPPGCSIYSPRPATNLWKLPSSSKSPRPTVQKVGWFLGDDTVSRTDNPSG
jgi:hypothetical protein